MVIPSESAETPGSSSPRYAIAWLVSEIAVRALSDSLSCVATSIATLYAVTWPCCCWNASFSASTTSCASGSAASDGGSLT